MKTVVLNGSPRRGGVVSQMLAHVCEALPEGCDIEWFGVGELNVRPCTGCMKCRSTGRCALPQDDAHRVAEAIRGADLLIVGSPCYWGNMSGQLKLLFDRVVYAMMGGAPQRHAPSAAQGQAGGAARGLQYGLAFQRLVRSVERRVPCAGRGVALERLSDSRQVRQERVPQVGCADGPRNSEM